MHRGNRNRGEILRVFKSADGRVITKGMMSREDLEQAFIFDVDGPGGAREVRVLGLTPYGRSLAERPSALRGLWQP